MIFDLTLDNQFKDELDRLNSKYGEKMMTLEGMGTDQLDTTKFFKNFISTNTVADASIDDNANVTGKNITTMIHESQKPFLKLLSRNKLYIEIRKAFGKEVADEFLEKVINGELYEHDSHLSSYMPYCFAFSLEPIVEKGLFFLDEMASGRPKHWDTFNHHVLEFIAYATNQQAGAVGIPDYLIYAYYFYEKDSAEFGLFGEAKDRFREQKFQEFIYSLNQPYLKSGVQSAYTNVSILDIGHLIKFFGDKRYPDGTPIIEKADEILRFQKLFLKYIGKVRREKWHTFPVISASLIFKDGEYEDYETAKAVVEHNFEYGFNDVNIMNVEEATSLASCCRLISDTSELDKGRKTFNSIGGSDVNVGSTKVVTLNLVRLALLANGSKDKFIDMVRENVELIHKYHYAHRRTLQELVDNGLLPLYQYGLMSFEDQFATVGINGVFEAVKVLGGIDETEDGVRYNNEGLGLAEEMFKVVNEVNDTTLDRYGFMSNIEQIPGESASVKLVAKDRLYFGDYKVEQILGEDVYIYGNQWIPLKEQATLESRIEASQLDNFCGGGAILHINLGENFQTLEDAWEFTNSLAKAGVKYFSYISLINICEEDHSFFGERCSICGGEVVSQGIKIVGYLVKQDSYKKERKRELSERVFY